MRPIDLRRGLIRRRQTARLGVGATLTLQLVPHARQSRGQPQPERVPPIDVTGSRRLFGCFEQLDEATGVIQYALERRIVQDTRVRALLADVLATHAVTEADDTD